MISRVVSAIALALLPQILFAQHSDAQPPKANTARLMWSAFSCAAFAEMSGDKKEHERLFKLGYRAGKAFVDSVRTKTISDTELKEAPVGVLWHMGGPTTDFIVGRIFEAATGDAYDQVVKEDSSGLLITDPRKWADDELKVIRAKNMYQRSNCALVH